jgi:hypothetical protein
MRNLPLVLPLGALKQQSVRVRSPLAVLVLVACSNGQMTPPPTTQAGCTAAACDALAACRIQFNAEPSFQCANAGVRPTGFSYTPYCVQACNAQRGAGPIAQCIADHGGACTDGGFADVLSLCDTGDAGPSVTSDCFKQCSSTRQACDDKCTGGTACDTCVRSGGQNCPCPDSGYVACFDCSAACGLKLASCLNGCP